MVVFVSEQRDAMLSDEQWAVLEPLVEACRPIGKTPPQNLRRTLSAILWRHRNGTKWRAIPAELGPRWRAAQVFMRWARADAWEQLLNLVQERGLRLGMVFLDGTNVRAHPKAAGAARRGDLKPSECLAIRVGFRLKATDVIDVLSDPFIWHGVPGHVRSNN